MQDLKPFWTVISDYLVKFLLGLSIFFTAMELTVKFECRPVVDCSAESRHYALNISIVPSQLQHRNICEEYYSSQRAGTVETRKEVVSDIVNALQYSSFINSECSKSATKWFLAYFSLVLFIQAFVLMIIDNLWLKLPPFPSAIEEFTVLVMECNAFPLLTDDEKKNARDVRMTAGETGNDHNDISTARAQERWYKKLVKFCNNIVSLT